MPEFLPKYKSTLYKEFQSINKQSHRKVIAFFESKKHELNELDFDHYFDLLTDYSDALFETGLFHKYLEVADELLNHSIEHNIYIYKGKDLYNRTLFRKAAAFFNLHQYHQSEHILNELIKINPLEEKTLRFYQRVLYKLGHPLLQKSRSFFVVLILASAMVTGIELFIVRTLFPELTSIFENSRNLLFVLGLAILILGDIIVRVLLQRYTLIKAKNTRINQRRY